MKLPGLLMIGKAFLRGARALEGIERTLSRIADTLDGKTPAAVEVAPTPDHTRHRPLPNDEYLEIERIEARLRRALGRDPEPAEIVQELDGLEHSLDDLPAASRERLSR